MRGRAINFCGGLILGWVGLFMITGTFLAVVHLSAMFAYSDAGLRFPWHILRMTFAMSGFFGLLTGVLSALGAPDSDRSRNGGDSAGGSVHDSAGRRHRP